MKKFQPYEFNLRSTMPSILGKKYRRLNSDGVQNRQQIISDTSTPYVPALQLNSKVFFVRISPSDLEEQQRIYEWRMKCSENLVGIKSYKLQSEGNCYNPNYLFKIQLQISKSNFSYVKNLNLTKCITIMKSGLQGLKILCDNFQPIQITDKMIYVSEQGEAKVWMDERFYINPYNSLYCKKIGEKISEFCAFKTFVSIFQAKCLKTKLSTKFFHILLQQTSIEDALQVIKAFQLEQNLFLTNSSKFSLSTSPGLTNLNTSDSLQFSFSRQNKKKKQKCEKDSHTNLATQHKFLQVKSLQLNEIEGVLQKKKRQQMVSKSQNEHVMNELHGIQECKGNPQSLTQETQSILVSQIFKQIYHPENPQQTQCTKVSPKLDKISFNFSNLGQSIRQYNFHETSQGIVHQYSQQNRSLQQQQNENRIKILNSNGWKGSVELLLNKMYNPNVKQSFSVGTEQDLQMKNFQLNKLHTMGKEVVESFLPVNQQSFEDY